jgi:Berberine and berberine like
VAQPLGVVAGGDEELAGGVVADAVHGDERGGDLIEDRLDAPVAHNSTGGSLASAPASTTRFRVAYTDRQWTRLTALKAKYDPTNFFRMNANIPPG